MPELPEVETVARSLRAQLVGRRFGEPVVRWKRTLGGLTPAQFARGITGARIEGIDRRAKWIVLTLDRGGAVYVHLRMTGRLQVDARSEPPGAWERLRIGLDDGRVLRFIDPRKFGRVRYSPRAEPILGELGPEPLGPDFTPQWFAEALRGRRRILKPLLLDQTFVAGLGNIYVDESLHRAGLHPLAKSERVRAPKARLLHAAIREVLEAAIEREGSSFDTFYRTPEGKPGSYQHLFRVYGREGERCLRCGSKIRRLIVGQRSSFFCPKCQPKPRA